MPLSSGGLCEAEITTPEVAARSTVRKATAGVVCTPARSASPPAAQMPETSAFSRSSPEARVSRPTTKVGRPCTSWPSASTAARPRSNASSVVRSSPATPRMPSVPKSRPIAPERLLESLPREQTAIVAPRFQARRSPRGTPMDLYLVRHAVAHDRSSARWPNDADRPLTPEGEEEFLAAARGLKRLARVPDLVLRSYFARAWRKAQLLTQ